MTIIQANDLIALFKRMAREHWRYEWGKAKEGAVDCSGAFVYAFKELGGLTLPHGSKRARARMGRRNCAREASKTRLHGDKVAR